MSRPTGLMSHLREPTLSGLLTLAFQGGLNNFAPFGAGASVAKAKVQKYKAWDCYAVLAKHQYERSPHPRHPALRRVSAFLVQGRCETKARQGFRAARLQHKTQYPNPSN